MADNLLEMAVRHLGSSGLSTLGKALGLSDGQTEPAFKTGAASVLAGMLNKAGTESGLGAMMNMAAESTAMDLSNPADIFTDPDKMVSLQQAGGNLLDGILGGRRDGVIDVLASSLGLDGTKSGSLLRIAAPMIMSLVGKLVKSKGLNLEGLAALLLGQKSHIRGHLPDGLLKELDAENLDELAERTVVETTPREPQRAAHTAPVKRSGLGKWLWPLLIALGVLWALNMCAKKESIDDGAGGTVIGQDEVIVEETPAEPQATAPAVTEGADEVEGSGDFDRDFREHLSGGSIDPNREFALKIEFPANGSTPDAKSQAEVQALIKIMQENPGLKIALEGYTDSDGDAGANQKLSEARVQAVKQMLTDAGIADDRVTARGLGPANPIADNSTEEGKQKNRRIVVKATVFERQ